MKLIASWWEQERGKVIALLLVVWILAIFQVPTISSIVQPLLAIVCTILFDIVFGWVRRKKIYFSLSSVLTGLLVGLLFDPSGSIWTIVVAGLIASGSKQFLQVNNRHIFNPAAIGIVVASMILHEPVAWWGAAWGMLPALLIAIWMIPVLKSMRRVWMPLTFLVIYFITNSIFTDMQTALKLTIDGTIFLFAFVMVPEPLTSVGRGKWQYGLGVLVGIVVLMITLLRISITDPLLLSLLVSNLIGFVIIRVIPSIRSASH